MESKVLYDAVSITSKIHSPQNFIEMLGLSDNVNINWQTVKGAHGYRSRMYWNCISIHFDGADDMGIWLEMTGQGCRAFETFGSGNYEQLFNEVLYNKGEMKLTRLDVAFDDLDGILPMQELCEDTREGQFVSKFNDWQVIESNKGCAVNHGSMKSDIFLRIYDKAKERGFTDGRHWIRAELQLRRDRALAFLEQGGGIGDRFAGVLINYLRYIEDDSSMDSNRWRWSMKGYWAALVGTVAPIQLYEKPGTEYNIGHLERFVYQQAGNAIAALLTITPEEKFRKRLKERGTVQNPKYLALIDEYRQLQEVES